MGGARTQHMTPRHWAVLATCVFCTFGCAAVAFSVPGLCYRPVSQYLGVDVFQVSFYMTIVYLAEVVLSPVMGKVLHRFDMRVVCTAAAVATSGGFMAMSFYTELWQWYVSGVLIGFGEITLLWLMVASLLNRWFKKRLGLVLGLTYAMTGVGGAVLNLIGQHLLGADLSGWREVYLVLGIVAFALSVPFTVFAIRSHPEDVGLRAYGEALGSPATAGDAVRELPGVPAKRAFRSWYFYALVFAGCMANVGGVFPQHFTTFYQSYVAIDRSTLEAVAALMVMSGTLEAFTMVGMAGGKVLIGALESKSVQLALVVGCVGGFLGLSCIWAGGEAVCLPVLFGGGLLYGLIYPFVTTLLPYVTRLVFGSRDYDQIYSVVLIPVNLVGAFAASGLALLYQHVGWDAFFVAGLASIVVIFAGFTVAYRAGRRVYLERL
ncbi:MFS transporter [Gordonibacter massiliensis (ex Traore et al. 2017)]|uniref:MFS transporter n=1 Tax=Gordonibacter massiliensis (ex Traore et al. 2017) TaxID=1841863 RepID=A0A842JCK7_9ACTN|nr:MFS transporter [Gordonibacter massiliensis (ex Traore et al. 2017)]MBC2889194.1 MFS transporter [Gordonibacter massiliensis (ex Traore et al. 2017)]